MCELNQEKIWRHFQGVGKQSFEASHPRLMYLAKRAKKWCGKKGGRVLNIGVGDGFFEERAAAAGLEVFSVDPDSEAVARVCQLNVSGSVGVIESLPFDAMQFDVVVASEVIEHLSPTQRKLGLAEISRVLKPGGLFLGTVPYDEDLSLGETACPGCGKIFHRWGHQASFTLKSMREELESHLQVLEVRRTAFVSFADRGIGVKFKSLCRLGLAKLGQQIASPNILYAAKRR